MSHEDDILLSDNDVVTTVKPKVVPQKTTVTTVQEDPVPTKKQRLSLQPSATVPGGFDSGLMATLIADQLKNLLPQAVSAHYNTLVAEKRKEEDEQLDSDSEDLEEDESSSEEEISVSAPAVPQLPFKSSTVGLSCPRPGLSSCIPSTRRITA